MKITRMKVKMMAIILAMLTALSFVGCDAGYAPKEDYYGEGVNNISGNMSPPGEVTDNIAADKAEAEEIEKDEAVDQVIVENPFVSTATNNISTFSADVDTASYAYFRKLVLSGYSYEDLANSGTAFRTEEFINYFKYSAPKPAENELFGVLSEITPCPWNEESYLLRLTLQAEQAVNTGSNNLVFLIDVSGSMSSADKLPLLKKAFSYLVGNLGADDTVSIVTYSGNEAVVLDGCGGLETERIMNAINELGASGSTNGEAGLTMAYQIAEKHFKADGNNRIIMASDGDLNVGISSVDELEEYIANKRDQGIYLSVLGFGSGNYRDAKMETIADNGNGVYYYIDGESEAEKVFGTDLLGTLYTVAEDVKLQLEFNPDRVDSYRLVGYENRVMANEDFENDAKDAGEVGASHQVTVCYEIKLKEGGEAAEKFITLRTRHKKPGESLSLLNEYEILESDISFEMSEDQAFICAVVETCMLLRQSQFAGELTLKDVLYKLESLDLSDYPERIEFRTLAEKLFKAYK